MTAGWTPTLDDWRESQPSGEARRDVSTSGPEAVFERDHAPGNMTISASRWPSLVVPPEHRPSWMPSPLALALHMTGQAPLEASGAHLDRGRDMELVGERKLARERGIMVVERQPRFEAPAIPALCYPDGLVEDIGGGETALVEFKTPVGGDMEAWGAGPPLHVRAQAQAQTIISGHRRVLIVPIIVGYASVEIEVYEEVADPDTHAIMLDAAGEFLDMLKRGDLPAPDATPSSYEAMCRSLRIKPERRIHLPDDFSEIDGLLWTERRRQWEKARAARLAAQKIEEAHKLAFAEVAGDAAWIDLDDGTMIKRTWVAGRVETKPREIRPSWRWSLSPKEGKK